MLANGVLHEVTPLGLTQMDQYLSQGALLVVVALVYSKVRRQAVV
jgi:hypothetical protein